MIEILIGTLLFAVLGSFYGGLTVRLPMRLGLIEDPHALQGRHRSACVHCGHKLGVFQLVPILSYIVQRGRCVICEQRISFVYFLVEAVAVLSFLTGFLLTNDFILGLTFGFLGMSLVSLSVIDLRHMVLPDVLMLPLLLIPIAILWLYPHASGPGFLSRAWGMIAGCCLLYGVRFLFLRIRHQEALGLGDVKLMGIAGFWVGISAISWVIFLGASLTILGVMIARHMSSQSTQTGGKALESQAIPIPFGPGIGIAFFIVYGLGFLGVFVTYS